VLLFSTPVVDVVMIDHQDRVQFVLCFTVLELLPILLEGAFIGEGCVDII
jgi:hypothetical protein